MTSTPARIASCVRRAASSTAARVFRSAVLISRTSRPFPRRAARNACSCSRPRTMSASRVESAKRGRSTRRASRARSSSVRWTQAVKATSAEGDRGRKRATGRSGVLLTGAYSSKIDALRFPSESSDRLTVAMRHSEDQRRSAWKRDLYRRFCAELAADQQSDAFFKIFYSDIRRSPIAIIGLNPGGNPANPDELQRASTFYDRDEHDYVDCKYPLAVKMRNFLLRSGIAADDDAIRAIPKLNVIFHRSVSLATDRKSVV